MTAESGYDSNEALELLKLGIKVRQDAEEIARYRAEQLLINVTGDLNE